MAPTSMATAMSRAREAPRLPPSSETRHSHRSTSAPLRLTAAERRRSSTGAGPQGWAARVRRVNAVSHSSERPAWIGFAVTVVLCVAAFAAMVWLTSDPARSDLVAGLVGSPMGVVVLFGLAAISTATLILPAPGLALTAIAGASGDPIVVGTVMGLGQAVGELTGYFAGRSGGSLLPDSAVVRRVTGWLERRGTVVIFFLALIPNPLFDLAGLAAGAIGLPILGYLAAAASGKVLKNVIIAGGASTIGAVLATLVGSLS
jgi:uncharacterized membrane protein YdjX (TVP38/TMEM64 family)